MNNQNSRAGNPNRLLGIVWIAPLLFIQVYLMFTLVLFKFGPWPWPVTHPVKLFGFLIVAQIFIAAGYLFSKNVIANADRNILSIAKNTAVGLRALKWSIFISLLLLFPTSYARTGSLLPDVISSLSQSGFVYNETFDLTARLTSRVYIEYFRIFLSPFLLASLPLTLLYWRHLNPFWKFTSSANLYGVVAIYIGAGQNKGLADFIAIAPWFMLAGWFLFGTRANSSFFKKLTLVGIGALLVLTFVAFFSTGQQQREGGVGRHGVFYDGASLIWANPSVVGPALSDDNRIAYESLSRYLTSGYYALDLSFNLESKSTYGFGNSMFLARNADAIGGFDFFTENSIPGRLETEFGYSQFRLWHSIYPWLASDFGYSGTLVIMAIFGYLLGKYWGLTLITGNYAFAILSYLLFIIFYYTPCNNQVFQSGETCVGFFVVLLNAMINSSRMRKAN